MRKFIQDAGVTGRYIDHDNLFLKTPRKNLDATYSETSYTVLMDYKLRIPSSLEQVPLHSFSLAGRNSSFAGILRGEWPSFPACMELELGRNRSMADSIS